MTPQVAPGKLERMRTRLTATLALGLALVVAGGTPLGAQDRLFLYDREVSTVRGQLGTLVNTAPPYGDDVALFGSRFVARLQWDPGTTCATCT